MMNVKMGDIGPIRRHIEIEPIEEPVRQPRKVPEKVPEKVPA